MLRNLDHFSEAIRALDVNYHYLSLTRNSPAELLGFVTTRVVEVRRAIAEQFRLLRAHIHFRSGHRTLFRVTAFYVQTVDRKREHNCTQYRQEKHRVS